METGGYVTTGIIEQLGIAVAMFVSTNLDDLLLIAAFFAVPAASRLSIVLGQYVGISALVLLSILAALVTLSIPARWIALLGLLPIALGLRQLFGTQGSDDDPAASSLDIASVAIVTVANGGDNVGIYVPVFAQNGAFIPLYVAVFLVLTGVWCAVGWALVAHPRVQQRVHRHGRRVLPWVFMAIGVHVLSAFFRP